ncbi:MAG: hypothetical protein IH969_08900, partial [Candidatus Krumholzibacteriota bacterium]|nr:hypothetical protein [Candidatus Krumholzibacteriota bacterium]
MIGANGEGCTSRVFEVGQGDVSFATIQDAIDATALPGDTVLVADNTYTGTGNTVLDFEGKNIVLKSANGPVAAIIDGEGTARGIIFQNGEDSTAVVDGFTFIRGAPLARGSAVLIALGSPTIRNCIMSQTSADSGVVGVDTGSPLFEFCTIQGDTATSTVGLVFVTGGSPSFDSCFVVNNI